MKKGKRKATVILFTALMCATLFTGCGGKNKETTDTSDKNATVTQGESNQQGTTDNSAQATPTATADDVKDAGFKEAPMLSDLVTNGTIPAVEERIPDAENVMIETVESVGTYGGSIQFANTSAGWNTGKLIEQGLFRFKADGSVEPNVAKGYDVNEDATKYTIYLRKGMKWSDGVDFTSEDCIFFYEHMCLPETFGKSLFDCYKVTNPETGETTNAKFTKVDDYSFTVEFESSKPTFIEELAINSKWCFAPAHYHKTVLAEFIGEEEAAAKATEMGFADIASLGKETGYYFWNVAGIPTLNPYILSRETGKNDVNGEYYEYVRNPYYWKVDQEGNQLPYVDKLEYTKLSDESQGLIKVLAGEVTIATVAWADIETIQENADSVGYSIIQWTNSMWADGSSQLALNQTAEDEDLRNLFQTKEFRQALSIGVDREEFSKLISDGWQDGQQASPSEGTLGASEEWAKKWTEYDPAAAKSLLEGLGLVMGTDGYYDFASGKDLVLNITSYTDSGADDTYVVLKNYFDAIGINTTYKTMDKDTLNNKIVSNDYDVMLSPVAPAETVNIMLRPDTLVPVRNYAEWYGEIGTWYASGGTEGVAPTGDLLELCNLYDQLKAEPDAAKREEIALKMLKLHEENIWVLGYMSAPTTLITVDNKLMNFPSTSVFSDEFRGLGIAHIDCCYFTK